VILSSHLFSEVPGEKANSSGVTRDLLVQLINQRLENRLQKVTTPDGKSILVQRKENLLLYIPA